MIKDCQECGAALEDAASTCYSCGAQQSISDSPTTIPQGSTPSNSIVQGLARIWSDTTPKKRKKMLLICGASLIIAVAVIVLALSGARTNREPPFFGIQRGDSVETVEKILGAPDDFEDNGLRNFNYDYDVEFLNIDGYISIHFELDKVDTLYFYNYGTASINEYEDVIKFYTKKYGESEPVVGGNSYSSGERIAFWLLDNNTGLRVKYTPGSFFSNARITIAIYS